MIKKIFLFLSILNYSFEISAQKIDSLAEEKLSIHAQTTITTQIKPSFTAPYTGQNSLKTEQESRTSLTATLFIGAKLWKGASIFVNPEIAGGEGLSEVLGIGGATNGETFRIGDPKPQIYLARAFIRQVFDLNEGRHLKSQKYFHNHSDFNQLSEWVSNKYFAVTIGKFALSDYFDDNRYSHDPRTQFMNWGLMANGAWDYAANTRGYTSGIVLEYVSPKYEIKYASAILPKEANGNKMNWNIGKSLSNNIELTRYHKLNGRTGALRFLAYYNTTYMGDYDASVALNPINPDTKTTQKYGHYKFGFAINGEQEFNDVLGGFFRASWNDGKYETWAFTEIDRSFSAGLVLNGSPWNRKTDTVGFAYLINGISKPHQNYLIAGGTGFMLGDGKLNYAPENIFETYYSAELVKNSIFLSGGYQLILNPGYNADRKGPANVFSIRVHCRI